MPSYGGGGGDGASALASAALLTVDAEWSNGGGGSAAPAAPAAPAAAPAAPAAEEEAAAVLAETETEAEETAVETAALPARYPSCRGEDDGGEGDEGVGMGAAGRPDDGVDQLFTGADEEEGEGLDHVLAAVASGFFFEETLDTGFRPRCGPWKSGHASWTVPPRAC